MLATKAERDAISEELLRTPYEYIRKIPGKQIRSSLAKAFNKWLDIDEGVLDRIMNAIEMLHNASLMIDDIEDSSELRRGMPVTHSVYGVPRTINSANYIYFVALSECVKLNRPEACSIFAEYMLELHRGQGKDLYWRDTVQCPTEEEYQEMVIQKTGGLFGLAVHLMELFSVRRFDFTPLIQNLALYFQIRDDYMNLQSDQYADLKGFAEDLTEGKFSLPIIFALRHRNGMKESYGDDELINIIRQKPRSEEVKKYCINLMRDRGAFSKTLDRLQISYSNIMDNIQAFGGNDLLDSLMIALHRVPSTDMMEADA